MAVATDPNTQTPNTQAPSAQTQDDELAKLREKAAAKAQVAKEEAAKVDYERELHHVGRTNATDGYQAQSVNLDNRLTSEAAVRELRILQQKCIIDYKDAAKLDVSYSVVGEPGSREKENELVQRLKSHNDAYTMSMLTSCLTPLSEGIDAGTLVKSFMSYKMIEIMNPNMEMDKSRMLLNFRSAIRPMLESNPVLAKMADAMHMDDAMLSYSADAFGSSLSKSLNDNTLDHLVMTPRQLAALKLNFTEQCYTDMRGLNHKAPDYITQRDACEDNYNKAVDHIRAIAENSGYDMSVVADEERYLVGIKMHQNPNAFYENVFAETSDVYSPSMKYLENSRVWQGDFVTADEHAYTSSEKENGQSIGAFSVSRPLDQESLYTFSQGLERRGQQYAWMQQFVKSDACTASPAVKKETLRQLEEKFDHYKKGVICKLQDDLGYSESEAKSFYDKSFTNAMKKEMKVPKKEAFSMGEQGICPFSENSPDVPGADFYREFRYTTEKMVYENLGYNISAGYTENANDALHSREESAGKTLRPESDLGIRHMILSEWLDNSAKHNGGDARTTEEIAVAMTDKHVKSMDADQLTDLMMHVGGNMEQGWGLNGTYSRHSEPSQFDVTDEVTITGEHVRVNRRSRSYDPDLTVGGNDTFDDNFDV